MNTRNFYYRLFLGVFVLVFAACEVELPLEDEIIETDTVSLDQEPIPGHIREKLEKLGFVVDEWTQAYKEGYLVEGDMYMTEASIDRWLKNSSGKNGVPGTEKHYKWFAEVNSPQHGSARKTYYVYVHTNISSRNRDRIQLSLNRFNDMKMGFQLEMVTDSKYHYDIEVILTQGLTNGYGVSAFTHEPTGNGDPGPVIELDKNTFGGYFAHSQMQAVMTHELGHAFAFRHMDYQDRSYSCGGSAEDEGDDTTTEEVADTQDYRGVTPDSWMLACLGNTHDRPFTIVDQIALHNLYGRFRALRSEGARHLIKCKPLQNNRATRYTQSHYQASNWEANGWYAPDNIIGRIWQNNSDGRVPLYQFYNPNHNDSALDTDFDHFGNGIDGWQYQNVVGYIYTQGDNNQTRIPLYRLYKGSEHRYTTRWEEWYELLQNGWNHQGITGYVGKYW